MSTTFVGLDDGWVRAYLQRLMKEAKARNDRMLLYGLPWTFPGWVRTRNYALATIMMCLRALMEMECDASHEASILY